MSDTHAVTNQVPPLEDYNPATSPVLTEALIREGGEWGLDEVTELGITAGMSMTEKQGGSDVRACTTQATPNGFGSYSLTGHKWFTSAPMCDIFLVLAQA